jgi:hypothetical protein
MAREDRLCAAGSVALPVMPGSRILTRYHQNILSTEIGNISHEHPARRI